MKNNFLRKSKHHVLKYDDYLKSMELRHVFIKIDEEHVALEQKIATVALWQSFYPENQNMSFG